MDLPSVLLFLLVAVLCVDGALLGLYALFIWLLSDEMKAQWKRKKLRSSPYMKAPPDGGPSPEDSLYG